MALAAPWVLWAAVRTFGLEGGHPLTGAVALTPYVAASAPLPVIVALALRRWVVSGVALAAALALSLAVLPRAIDGPALAEEAQGRTLVVMSSNMYVGRADASTVVRLAREHHVDVLSLQELTPEAVEHLDDAGVRSSLPNRVLDAHSGVSGSGLMARHALRRVGGDDAATFAQPEAALALAGGGALYVKAIHLLPPVSGRKVSIWRRELRGLPLPSSGRDARVLIGDFNATLDHDELRRLLDRGYRDVADATGDGLKATWPVGSAHPPIAIDHVLVSGPLLVRRVSVHEIAGSDHRAIIAELVVPT